MKKALGIIVLVLFIDQALKFWIKTNLMLGESITVFPDWFFLHFVENNGMAFGMEFGGSGSSFGKIFLTTFRLFAIFGIAYYLFTLIRDKKPTLLIVSISFVFAGATGNAIDSLFYGLCFSESNFFELAKFLPAEGGYGGFMMGKVVDMFYFPIFPGTYPEWIPFFGGSDFLFFRPVFNIADASITTGVLILILFQKRFFGPFSKHWSEDIEEEETH